MATAAGIWTHHASSAQALSGGHPAPLAGPAGGGTGGSGGSGGSADSSSTISANDFLTLLVTEMQNQDPTDNTDPNAYIDQLVQVNSLEQLIDINQNLSTVLGVSNSSPSGAASSPQLTGAAAGVTPSTPDGAPSIIHPAAHKGSALGQLQSNAAQSSAASTHAATAHRPVAGNLSIPEEKPAAHRVAEALSGLRAP